MGVFKKIFKSTDVADAAKDAGTAAPTTAAEPKKQAPTESAKIQAKQDPEAYRYLCMPLITEKATELTMLNKYCFIVPKSVNKSEVLKKIANAYGVKPIKINFCWIEIFSSENKFSD